MDVVPSAPPALLSPRPRLLLLMLPGTLILMAVLCSTSMPGERLNPATALATPILTATAFWLLWLGSRPQLPGCFRY